MSNKYFVQKFHSSYRKNFKLKLKVNELPFVTFIKKLTHNIHILKLNKWHVTLSKLKQKNNN